MKRLLAVVAVATACVALVQPALAQEMGTPDFLTGGSPTNRSYQFFSGGYAGTISRTTVTSPGSYAPGSIFINTAERRLYLILENGQALRYGIGVGRDGFRWAGVHKVTQKREWPDWTPPAQMLRRRPDLPRHMKGGPDNPLGPRAHYLYRDGKDLIYRIHGTTEPWTIGSDVSSGCIRMLNEDVIDLYQRVPVGTRVLVLKHLSTDKRVVEGGPIDLELAHG
jgi:lipoprotein-anchoring transpeptidase ErfK/SrfK